MQQRSRFPEWPALVAIGIWGSLAAVAGGSLAGLRPSMLLALAFAAAAAAMAVVELARGAGVKHLARPNPRDLAVGVLGLGGYHALLFLAFDNAPLVEANLLNYLWPLLTVLLSAPIAGEKLHLRSVAGAALGLTGTALVILGGSARAGQGEVLLGYGAAAGAALSWATFSNVLKARPIDPRSLPLSSLVVAALAAGWALADHAGIPSGPPLFAALYVGALPIGAASVLWEAGIRRGRVSVVGALAYLTPLLSTLGVWLFLGRPLTPGAAAGGALILLGAALGASGRRV